jgi:hypothetical protein
VIAEATKLLRFVLSIVLGSGCLKYCMTSREHWQESQHVVPTLSAVLLTVCHQVARVVTVNVQIETVNRGPLIAEVIAHKYPGGSLQLFLPKHLLQTAVGNMFLERNVDFYQSICIGYCIQNPISYEGCFIHQQLSTTKGWSNIIYVSSSNEYSTFCAILQYVTCLP